MKFFLTFLIAANTIFTHAQVTTKPIIGDSIAYYTFLSLDSNTVEIGKPNTGKYLLIDYYFTTCGPCNRNLKIIDKLIANYSNKLNVISVNPTWGDSKEKIMAHRLQYNIHNPIVFGNEARKTLPIFSLRENGMGFPFYILINPENKVVFTSMNNPRLYNKIANLIK